MPKMVSIQPAMAKKPGTSASTQEKRNFEAIVKRGTVKMDFASAVEAIANSKGMYEIAPDTPAPVAGVERKLEDMGDRELKALYFQIGGKVDKGKQLRRTDVIAAIEAALDQIEMVDEIPEDDEIPE